MANLKAHFADYAAHHRAPLTKATHAVGIPLIALCLLGLGSKVTLFSLPGGPSLDLGIVLAAALVATYLTWHVGLAVGTAVLLVPLYLAGRAMPLPWLFVGLVLGVGLQYLGHYAFEHNSPAFHRNAMHTLVGPLWMVAELYRSLGLYRAG